MAKNYNVSATLEVINKFTKPIQQFKEQLKSVSAPVNQAKENIKGIEKTTNESVNNASNSLNKLVGKFKSVATSIGAGLGISKIINTSDMMTNLHSRLDLMNDGLQTTEELQEKIFKSAQASRGSYQDMAEMVAKLGVNAKDAFSSNDQIVQFGENMNKIFKLGGASSVEQSAGMLQLTQALSSGKLQGDEFRSITENAPELIGILAEKLGKTRAEIKQMSTDGELTSDVIVNAVLDSTDKINSQFGSMPLTWADVWTNIKNTTLKATQPILNGINKIVNSETFKQMQTKFGEVANYISTTVIPKVQEKLPVIKQKISDLLALINKFKPILIGVASAFVAFKTIDKVSGYITKFKKSLSKLSILTSPIGMIAIAIGAVVAGFIYAYTHSETFRDKVNNVVEVVKEKVMAFKDKVVACIVAIKGFLEEHKEQINAVKDFIKGIIDLIIEMVGDFITNVGTVIGGIIDVISGVIDIITGIFKGDWNKVWEGFKEVVNGAIEIVKGWWNGLLDLFKKPINFVVNLFKKDQSESTSVASSDDEDTDEEDNDEDDEEEAGHNATGTNDWKGGLTWVGEKGKELVNLPRGSQVFTTDESKKMINDSNKGKGGISVSIGKIADKVEINNGEDAITLGQKIGNAIADAIYIAGLNMA